MILCAGASSRRVVEEAAKAQLVQIVASRRQVGEFAPGYTGFTSETLVETVRKLSGGATAVVRDHGGPFQNGDRDDDWAKALDADVAAGFDVLHIDVCKLSRAEQGRELKKLCKRYYPSTCSIEIGGERDPQVVLDALLAVALEECQPSAAVADLGGHIWADRQYGKLVPASQAQAIARKYSDAGVVIKAHNCDWAGGRKEYEAIGFYNVAPEFGNVEVDAWLTTVSGPVARTLLDFGYHTEAWRRWFHQGEGTWFERARCGLRYHLDYPEVTRHINNYDDAYVRRMIRDALFAG